MRRVQSAPQLQNLSAAPLSATAAARFAGSGSPLHPQTQTSVLAKHTLKVSTDKAFFPSAIGRRSCSTNALPLLAPIPPPPPDDATAGVLAGVFEQADELLEEIVWAKGLIPAGECFEQFGWTESAPALKDTGHHATEEQRKGLASCLATPFMYDDEHLSKRAQESVLKRGQIMEQQLTHRFAEEVQSEQGKEEIRNSSSYAGQEAVARSRRRKRPDKMMAYAYHQTQAPSLVGIPTNPENDRRLARALSSVDDNKNKLHLDEQFLTDRRNSLATSSLDPASMSMEAADTQLFVPGDMRLTEGMQCAPGAVMIIARDTTAMLVQQDTYNNNYPGSSEDSVNKPVPCGKNESDAKASTDGNEKQDSHASAEMQSTAQNNIVPFLLARIAEVIE